MDPIMRLPGFRFVPSDEELVDFFLTRKVADCNYVCEAIGEVDFNQVEPWDLRARAKKVNEITMFFFTLRDKKYPTGVRTNRATKAGYWKATGKDREVLRSRTGSLVGMKKTLVFYAGRAPNGQRTHWVMHEYRIEGQVPENQEEWVVCRIFEKSSKSCTTIGPERSDTTRHNTVDHSSLQLPSFRQSLPGLRSPHSQIGKPSALTEQECLEGSAEHGETSHLKRSFSAMTGRRDLQLGDTLDDLISGWDMGSPVPIWDYRAGS